MKQNFLVTTTISTMKSLCIMKARVWRNYIRDTKFRDTETHYNCQNGSYEHKKKTEKATKLQYSCSHATSSIVVWSLNTQRQARELISGPDLATGDRLLSFNRTQTKVVIGLLTGHNTLRRLLCITGIGSNPICRSCCTEEETSVHILCECEALASLRHTYLGFFSGPGRYQESRCGGPSGALAKAQVSLNFV